MNKSAVKKNETKLVGVGREERNKELEMKILLLLRFPLETKKEKICMDLSGF